MNFGWGLQGPRGVGVLLQDIRVLPVVAGSVTLAKYLIKPKISLSGADF